MREKIEALRDVYRAMLVKWDTLDPIITVVYGLVAEDMDYLLKDPPPAEVCEFGYLITDFEWVGWYVLDYGDIERDGTLN